MTDMADLLRQRGINPDDLEHGAVVDLPPKPEITIEWMPSKQAKPKRKNKYHNRRVEADGYTFDSRAEYERYLELKLLRDAGEITDLRVHPRYVLLPAFTDGCGNRHRGITYEADFEYREGDVLITEDVKGVATPVFRIKQKLLLSQHPEMIFRQINVRK